MLGLTLFLLAANSAAGPSPELARHVCPNGLEVVVAERHARPLVTAEIAVHSGAMNEPPEYSGLSHLFEHMFFKANREVPDQVSYMARRRELGITGDASTDVERVNYFQTTTRDHFEGMFTFMHAAITGPLFDPGELDRERVVVTGEIDRNESTPGYFLWRETTRHLFAKYPTRKDPLGTRKTVLAATPAMMRTIARRWYVPNNAVLVVVGDVESDEVFRMADSVYADWKKTADPFLSYPVPEPPPLGRSEVVLVEQPVQTFQAQVEWQGPSTGGPTKRDSYVADLLGRLTSDPASRFQRELVDSSSCVRAGFEWEPEHHVGPIVVSAEAAQAKVDVCIRALLAELRAMAEPGFFTEEDRRDAADRAESDLARLRERTSEYAHMLTYFWATRSLEDYGAYVAGLRAVGADDVARFLSAYVLGKPFVFGAMASPNLVAAGVDRKHLENLAGLDGAVRTSADRGGR
ncbi:MAG TPA: pitrilysin family protein [Polyangiaceae bacterium]|nr:pitrilysin family protein [Polyangiaceae bacterium]